MAVVVSPAVMWNQAVAVPTAARMAAAILVAMAIQTAAAFGVPTVYVALFTSPYVDVLDAVANHTGASGITIHHDAAIHAIGVGIGSVRAQAIELPMTTPTASALV